jgi:gamma-glutamylcyclotransferase (GGCT)/AIG2-like uncharacterized protein YtfP
VTVHYFAYGSNLDLDGKLRRWAPSARLVDVGRAHGRRLAFTRRSTRWGARAADVLPADGHAVWGALFSIDEHDVPGLDACEGAPRNYRRLHLQVETESGHVPALTYEVVDRHLPEAPPSSDYLATIVRGARSVGLHADWIDSITSHAEALRARPAPGT